ncbi:glycosyltransferase [Acinetobacter pittii]|uniref:glycosyltransferase n=1 Tax=Acinetobacter pittii TaxID=48296 RepID=UPI0004495C3E|nr:glycosyltransferase [Acinetobacter pittii]EXS24703.1 glycosyl transferases group 1 family protein [Acinetobacter baumannii 573719]MBJ8472950.1 glycosyltransferase [Acinetobacter pittii]MCG5227817.1 glycosyltransferase [Acinetobacter pittii]MDN4021607.1 glycosyltransferase [Acinetobacter pittii]
MSDIVEENRILFLSAIDFKEKSIQVIRKTPEFYALKGWTVDYVVARDNIAKGNYSYEKEISPTGVNVDRFYWPLLTLRSINNRYLSLLFSKFAAFFVVLCLAFKGYKKLKSNSYNVVYGYEFHGVLALLLLKPFLTKQKIVTRFQGTFVNEMIENKQWLRLFFNFDLLIALKTSSDLTIMTNDGTNGDKALLKLRGINKLGNMRFWVNGVDKIRHKKWPESNNEKIKIVSISRLIEWKRVDRCIKVVEKLVESGFVNFEYEIIGGGDLKSKLEKLVESLGLNNFIKFSGAIPHTEALEKLENSQIFFSMYDSSNVGNPLLEAIRANKIIVTLNNGDTGSWIKHKINGLIYDPSDEYYEQAATDIYNIIKDPNIRVSMLEQVALTEKNKLWDWHERLSNEESLVKNL